MFSLSHIFGHIQSESLTTKCKMNTFYHQEIFYVSDVKEMAFMLPKSTDPSIVLFQQDVAC